MKIESISMLYLINTLDFGGAEKSTITYANRFLESVKSISFFSQGGFYLENNILDSRINIFPEFKPGIKNLYNNLKFIIKIIEEEKINLIIYHHRKFAVYSYFISKYFPELKIIYVAQNLFNDFLNMFLVAHHFVALTQEVAEDLKKYNRDNIAIIPHRIEVIPEIQTKYVPTIGYVGRFEEDKGIKTLLEAFQIVHNKHKNTNLFFRGKGSMEKRIKKFALDQDLLNVIKLFPPELEIPSIYHNIGILILPSLKLEGQGIVLIEAMNLGIPVIGSDVGGIKNVIKNNYNGLLFRRGDASNLADKILILIENESIRNNLIKKAKEDVLKNYNLNQTISDYLNLFKKL